MNAISYFGSLGFTPEPGEVKGIDGTYKRDAYGRWQAAERAKVTAENTFGQVLGYMDQASANEWRSKLVNMINRFNGEFNKIKGYSDKWTRWGIYAQQADVWRTQWLVYAAEVREAGLEWQAKKTGKPAREVKPGVLKRRKARKATKKRLQVVKEPEAAAAAIRAEGETAIPPTQANETLLWVGAGVLGLAILWTLVPEESKPSIPVLNPSPSPAPAATSGLGRRPRRRRR